MDGEGKAPWWRGGIRVLDDGEAMAAIAIAPAVRKGEGGKAPRRRSSRGACGVATGDGEATH